MSKFSTISTNKILLKFIIKSIITTILSVILLCLVSSFAIYKFDVDLKVTNIISIIICCVSSFFISYISVGKIKNNGALMGMLSELPLIFYCTINVIFSYKLFYVYIIKVVMIIVIGFVSGILRVKQNNKFKVK
jgi:putative membrane protein (TIGR04086 family)